MEKILNDEEKIRKAEEIYYRRNNRNIDILEKEKSKTNKGYIKNKIFLQLLIMFDIAVIVFAVQNKDFIFTQEFLGKINEYNINISSQVITFLGNIVDSENVESETTSENENVNTQNQVENNLDANVGGVVVESKEVSSSISEMELDVENLKVAYSFQKPFTGTVTSNFGTRESSNQNIEGYHTGIDLAGEAGTYIKAAMQGIVTEVSSNGDYGNHLKIRCNNVTTLYAHCLNILVKEGQIVSQGQDIASVGSTGNSTGPHLHFEIRIDDRYVDPSKVIQF